MRIGIIGGSGLGESLRNTLGGSFQERCVETPFGPPAAPLLLGELESVPVALLQRHGPGHRFNPSSLPYRANVYALKAVGCTHVVASGATGSLREDIHPGEVVLCDQLIDRTVARPRTFFDAAAVHVEFADPFCPLLRGWLESAGARIDGLRLHPRGTYVCMEGPSFSTRAESACHRQIGGDVVGMTALPEARLAREAEMAYALLALPTDYDCWRPRAEGDPVDDASLLREIIGNLERATAACLALVRAALRDVSALEREPSPAHDALRLAIWSDRARIDRAEVARLGVLWGRYFE